MRRSTGTHGSAAVALLLTVIQTTSALPPAVAGPLQVTAASASPAPPSAAPDDTGLADSTPDRTEVPPAERRPLGAPNGVFSARPAANGATAGDDAGEQSPLLARWLELARIGGALALVIALIAATRWALRRAGGGLAGAGRPSGVLEILARYPVSRGQSLVLLKLDRRILLLHQTGAAMTTLSEMTDANEVGRVLGKLESGSRSRDAMRFRSLLRGFEHDHDDRETAATMRLQPPDAVEVIDLTRSARGRRRLTA